jgi:hypothetical protein
MVRSGLHFSPWVVEFYLSFPCRVDQRTSREHCLAHPHSTNRARCMAGLPPSQLLPKAVSDRRIAIEQMTDCTIFIYIYISPRHCKGGALLLGEESNGVVVEALLGGWRIVTAIGLDDALSLRLGSATCGSPRLHSFTKFVECSDSRVPIDAGVSDTLSSSQCRRA